MNSQKSVVTQTQTAIEEPLSLFPYKRMRFGFILAICLQFAMLAAIAAPSLYTMVTGKTVTLRTVPVDPWDMFRGSYVTLEYEISEIPNIESVKDGDAVYVVLKKAGNCWAYESAHRTRAEAKGDVVIKGIVQWRRVNSNTMHVDYKIGRMYLQEGAGTRYEKAKHLLVDVGVDSSGNALVKSAVIEQLRGGS